MHELNVVIGIYVILILHRQKICEIRKMLCKSVFFYIVALLSKQLQGENLASILCTTVWTVNIVINWYVILTMIIPLMVSTCYRFLKKGQNYCIKLTCTTLYFNSDLFVTKFTFCRLCVSTYGTRLIFTKKSNVPKCFFDVCNTEIA